ncbi:MAG: hypothetical protein V7K21_13460 [Nostoc sp.]|uniref:hypothetical protein n=1 Tax=Nostoc sp. TaxID=1180 RepID=UPI002FF63CB8
MSKAWGQGGRGAEAKELIDVNSSSPLLSQRINVLTQAYCFIHLESMQNFVQLGEVTYNAARERLNTMAIRGKLLPEWDNLPLNYQQRFEEEVIRVSAISLQLLLPNEFWLEWTDNENY